jgi:hypothetical protein
MYEAWRNRMVVSLATFDVQVAFNKVNNVVLQKRLLHRGIPETLGRWFMDFCSNRTATITIDTFESETLPIAQDGIPQGSPLFPILYIFYNANLVEQPIHKTQGALGSADDHSAWVVEESIDENIRSLQTTIIPKAEGWARESGAIFEPTKTGLNHFTRRNEKEGHEGTELRFSGQDITASADVKLLGVTLDSKMKFQQHVATVTARATRQCLAIRRLQGSGRSKSDNCITPQLPRSWTTALLRGIDRRNGARSLFFATWRGYNVSEHRL